MKVPLSWLKEFIPITESLRSLAETLTLLGIEVEKIEGGDLPFEGVVTAKVLKAEKHPEADRLKIATVFDGKEEFQVVCGAPNCRDGLTVAFAKIGATLYDKENKSWTIKKSKLRGIDSFGMLCSEEELGVPTLLPGGILELDPNLPLGHDVKPFILDPVLDLSLTPNMGHALSILGIARELSAALQRPLNKPERTLPDPTVSSLPLSLHLEAEHGCSEYSAVIVENVHAGEAPAWLKKRLEQAGIRSVNLLVDIGNFVMVELGQPLHLFDLHKLKKKNLVVTLSEQEISLTSLDGKARLVPKESLLICDEKEPVAIAGIMGLEGAQITPSTTAVVIESALFSSTFIRKTSRALNLKTEASYRFERGVDPLIAKVALQEAVSLICKLIPEAKPHSIRTLSKEPFTPKTIPLRLSRTEKLVGFALSKNEIISLLERLQMKTALSPGNDDLLLITPPSYRLDLSIEDDLIEEIVRLFGYHHLPKKNPRLRLGKLSHTPLYEGTLQARELLLRCSLLEVITCDLISPLLSNTFKPKNLNPISVLAPRSLEQSVLRTTLLPGLLDVAKTNFAQQNRDLALFEIGKVHFREKERVVEPTNIAILLSGAQAPYFWKEEPSLFDFYDLKGVVISFLQSFGISDLELHSSAEQNFLFHPGKWGTVSSKKQLIGTLGELHPEPLLQLGLKYPILFAELNFDTLLSLRGAATYQEMPIYPGSHRDWTVTLPPKTTVGSLLDQIQRIRSPLLEKYEVLSLYETNEKRNLTIRFFYRDKTQTIQHETVEKEQAKLQAQLSLHTHPEK